ncbi:MAG: SLC45 family MFS transporter [Ruminococcaceae bacterium]|nr:SLC45 family MFS transporter [Oscillospiraceae bacterium]
MNKKMTSLVAVYAIVLVTFCILYLVIPFPKTGAYWIEFVFSIIAVCAGCGIGWYSLKNDGLKSKVYGFPILNIGIAYMAVQLIFAVVIAIVGFFAAVPLWVSIVFSVLILAISAIGFIGADNARDIIEEQESCDEIATKAMKMFRLDTQYIVDLCDDSELKKSLEKLAEQFKYSDPVSSDELADIEENLQSEVKNLAALVNSDRELAAKKISDIMVLLADRNRRCKELKK